MSSKPRWGDEVGEELGDELPAPSVVGPDKNGIKIITEYFEEEDGKKFKVVRKVKVKKVTQTVSKEVARRKQLKKFGKASDHPPGPSPSTTTISEEIPLKLSLKTQKEEVAPQDNALENLKKKEKTIVCRICAGDHFTLKCPYKELEEIANFKPEDIPLDKDDKGSSSGGAGGNAPGKYVPPSLRGGGKSAPDGGKGSWSDSKGGDSMSRERELPTLRVTNISEDTMETDLRDLFERFGAVQRIHLAKDKITKLSKGYAFISFYSEKEAERAMKQLNGHGYDNLILQVDWAKRQ